MVSEKEFNELLVKYRPYIISQVRSQGGREDTEDFVQDIILQACRSREAFDPAKGAFVTWLWWQIRSCLQQRRFQIRKRRPINVPMEYMPDGTPMSMHDVAISDDPISRIELRETLGVIQQMQPRQAAVILQMAVGATLSDLSDEYGITKQRVQQIHRKGRDQLRKRTGRKAPEGQCSSST